MRLHGTGMSAVAKDQRIFSIFRKASNHARAHVTQPSRVQPARETREDSSSCQVRPPTNFSSFRWREITSFCEGRKAGCRRERRTMTSPFLCSKSTSFKNSGRRTSP